MSFPEGRTLCMRPQNFESSWRHSIATTGRQTSRCVQHMRNAFSSGVSTERAGNDVPAYTIPAGHQIEHTRNLDALRLN